MRTLAVSVAALLVLVVVSPAFAQPFADVPTDHWAFDAIAELAAKGIIEGFPDGTFKGDRGVTRYEVAMIVARILARIEAIKIPTPTAPAPTAPQVTRADVQTIQRLVNEFRAELAALGVRVTAVEEELTALKTKTTNVAVKGDVRFRYNVFAQSGGGAPSTRYRNRLTFTGNAGGNVTAVARASFGGGGSTFLACAAPPAPADCGVNSRQFRFDFDLTSPTAFQVVGFDYAYLDLKDVYGVNWRLGQQAYTLSGVGWSGYGLLYDPSNADIFSPVGVADGLKASGSWGGFSFEIADWRETTTVPFSNGGAMDIYTARVETDMLAGWKVGLSGIMQRRNAAVTTVKVTAAGGTVGTATGAANTSDTGYQVDLAGDLFPGLSLGAAYATFSPNAAASSNAWIGWAALDLSSMGMSMMSPTLTAWYKGYGSSAAVQIPWQTGASTEVGDYDYVAWNFTGWGAALEMKISPSLSGTFSYESGNQTITAGQSVQEYYASLGYSLAANTTLSLNYFNLQLNGAPTDYFYRVQLTYSY